MEKKARNRERDKSGEINVPEEPSIQPMALTIDWDLFGSYLEDSDLTGDQKRAFIETLWNIMVSFVDLGFGIHPVQQANPQNWGQKLANGQSSKPSLGDVIGLKDHLSKNVFLEAADCGTHHRRGEKES